MVHLFLHAAYAVSGLDECFVVREGHVLHLLFHLLGFFVKSLGLLHQLLEGG